MLPVMRRRGEGGRYSRSEKRGGGANSSEKEESLNLNPEGVRNLGMLLDKVSAYFESSLGIGMDDENAMDMDWFVDTGHYTEQEVAQDKEAVADREEIFARNDAAKGSAHEKRNIIANTFEKVVSVVFHYALQAGELSVVPATRHTDIFDGVDSFIIHEETGQVICAIDETNSNIKNIIQGSKLDNMLRRNEEEKIIKYGIALNEADGKWYPSELKRGDAPLAYLSAPRDDIIEFIDTLATLDVDYDEDVENLCDDLFTKLIDSLYQSLDHIMLNMPGQGKKGRKKMQGLIDLIQEETGLEPPKYRQGFS